MSIEQLKIKHPTYTKMNARWDFLYRSYLGGIDYKTGSYLRKYYGEEQAPYDAYAARLDVTPLDNHMKTTVDIYRSYLWRNHPSRTLGNLQANPFAQSFVADTDLDGQGIDSFMKTALDWAMVMGNVWINIDRPATTVNSAADEIDLNIRAYANLYTPQMVPDWTYTKQLNGSRVLTYLKVYELVSDDLHIIKEWYEDRVIISTVKVEPLTGDYDTILKQETVPNLLGRVPFISMSPQKNPQGTGDSILGDVADTQRSIYNKLSELEQTIRMSGHPLLVKTADTGAVAGAGGIVTIPDDMDPGLYPSLLQPQGSVESILKAIEHDVESIDKMTHLGAVRSVKGSGMSGEALKTERQLLNSKLSDLADIAEETEYKVWRLWMMWMEIAEPTVFSIDYWRTFDTKDVSYELAILEKSLLTVTNPQYRMWAEIEIVKLTVDDEATAAAIIASIRQG